MPELQRLRAGHAPAVLAFELANRAYFAASIACFTTDATDVTFAGTVHRGGTEIGRARQVLFDSFLKGTRPFSS